MRMDLNMVKAIREVLEEAEEIERRKLAADLRAMVQP